MCIPVKIAKKTVCKFQFTCVCRPDRKYFLLTEDLNKSKRQNFRLIKIESICRGQLKSSLINDVLYRVYRVEDIVEKEEMPVNSNVSILHSVFKRLLIQVIGLITISPGWF